MPGVGGAWTILLIASAALVWLFAWAIQHQGNLLPQVLVVDAQQVTPQSAGKPNSAATGLVNQASPSDQSANTRVDSEMNKLAPASSSGIDTTSSKQPQAPGSNNVTTGRPSPKLAQIYDLTDPDNPSRNDSGQASASSNNANSSSNSSGVPVPDPTDQAIADVATMNRETYPMDAASPRGEVGAMPELTASTTPATAAGEPTDVTAATTASVSEQTQALIDKVRRELLVDGTAASIPNTSTSTLPAGGVGPLDTTGGVDNRGNGVIDPPLAIAAAAANSSTTSAASPAAASSVDAETAFERQRRLELEDLATLSAEVEFPTQSGTPTIATRRALDRIFETLFLYSETDVRISVSSNEYTVDEANRLLSQERGAAIVSYLVERGLDAPRFKIEASGASGLPSDAHRVSVSATVLN